MRALAIELQKEKRTGIIPVMLAVGVLGAAYAFLNFIVRRDSLLSLPMAPMDVLLTQLYGMLVLLNLLGIVVASCMIYNMEFKGNAVKKMYMLPVSVVGMYLCKFLILTVLLFAAVLIENLTLAFIGIANLPQGTFQPDMLVRFAGYSFLTSMPTVSFMLLVSSRCENMWIPLGIGVAGFLSGMSLVNYPTNLLLIHPVVLMLRPAVAMSVAPNQVISIAAIAETVIFLLGGLWMAKSLRYE
ncbi:MAG: ABC transporter permease [Oscillospiraceae bacterium]|nr:ABC transporter permease [Oscillospiraceae bacterium]